MQNTNVIAVGMEPVGLTGHDRDPLQLAIDAPQRDIEGLIDALDADAIAILPAARLEPALRRLHVLQSALDGRVRIACCQTRLSPLAARALTRLAASVAPHAPSAALLADVLPSIEEELLVAAIVPSVLRLRRPKPPLNARLRSLLPGARFVVADDLVAPVHGRHKPPVLLDESGGVGGVGAVAAGRLRGAPDLEGIFPGVAIDTVDAPPGLAAHWRAAQALEAVAYPTDPVALAQRVLASDVADCPWCGAAHAALPCALCGHDRDRELAA